MDSQSAKTTGVGGEQRGYDGGKKVRGILGDSCWWTPKGWFSQGQGSQRKGPRPGRTQVILLKAAREHLPRLSHLWVDAGYQGRGKQWAESRSSGLKC